MGPATGRRTCVDHNAERQHGRDPPERRPADSRLGALEWSSAGHHSSFLRSAKPGLAEVYRAGLSENLEYLHKDSIMLAEWDVSGIGDLVQFERRRPSVLLDTRMRWTDPVRPRHLNAELLSGGFGVLQRRRMTLWRNCLTRLRQTQSWAGRSRALTGPAAQTRRAHEPRTA